MTTTPQNILVLWRAASDRYHSAVTIGNLGDDSANLLAFGDGDDWEDSVPAGTTVRLLYGKDRGTGVDEWQPVPVTAEVAAEIAAATSGLLSGYASEAYADAGAAAAQAASVAAPASCGSTVSLAINTARDPSTARSDNRGTRVSAVVTWAAVVTGTASAEVVCDSGSNPSAVVMTIPFSVTLSLGVQQTLPVVIDFEVPAGWSYKVRAGAGSSGTVALASVYERAL